jgi:hypothetical protein
LIRERIIYNTTVSSSGGSALQLSVNMLNGFFSEFGSFVTYYEDGIINLISIFLVTK